MSARERIGLTLVAVAFAIAPFAYWVNVGWILFALVPLTVGFVLLHTGRVARRMNDSKAFANASGPDVPPGPHELKGFFGATVLRRDNDAVHDDD